MRHVRLSRSFVLLTVLVLIVPGVIAYKTLFSPTHDINSFLSAYAHADDASRQKIAREYLDVIPAGTILSALEKTYPLCHSQAHPVGRAIFQKTQNLSESMRMCQNSCSSGCFHGILMQMFASSNDTFGGTIEDDTASTTALLAQIESKAPTLCTLPAVTLYAVPVVCIHGTGHVFTYAADYHLDRALKGCTSAFAAKEKQQICSSGVFMEYMTHISDQNVIQAPYYPCDVFSQFATGCYRYKAPFMLGSMGFAGAMTACRRLDSSVRFACIAGVGRAAVTLPVVQTPHGLDELCNMTDVREKAACEKGAISGIVLDIDVNTNVGCESLAAPYKGMCVKMLEDIRAFK